MATKTLIHVVSYNSAASIGACAESLVELTKQNSQISVEITDNASSDDSLGIIDKYKDVFRIFKNEKNLGFSAAHNQAVSRLLKGSYDYLLILNPDAKIELEALNKLIEALENLPLAGIATPRILRANLDLKQTADMVIDACGMILSKTLRHFDRASGERDVGQFMKAEYVFGGTGACLLLKRTFIEELLLPRGGHETTLFSIFPDLENGVEERAQLFDEAFFAYREDADLAWRAMKRAWRVIYVPEAVAYHVRVVTPERRSQLKPELNRHSVRNRFLLQANNFSISRDGFGAFIGGVLIRNLFVIIATIFIERRSLGGIIEALRLLPRAFSNREKFNRLRHEA